jgi:hypothetical protein
VLRRRDRLTWRPMETGTNDPSTKLFDSKRFKPTHTIIKTIENKRDAEQASPD